MLICVALQVYLESPRGGPHHTCAQLNLVNKYSNTTCVLAIIVVPIQINWTNKKIETVVDYVKRPTEGET